MSLSTSDNMSSSKKKTSSTASVLAAKKVETKATPIYVARILSETVQLTPRMLNTFDIDNAIIETLKKKVEGHCISDGYIKPDSIQIISRSLGCMENHNFSGNVMYNLRYKADICCPVKDQHFECIVGLHDETNSVCYVGDIDNSPVEIYLFRENYLGNADYASLKPNDKILVKVVNTQIEFGNDKILVGAEYIQRA